MGVLGLGLISTLAGAQVTQPVPVPRALITEGDPVIGLGAMRDHKNAQVSDAGMWIGQIVTSFSEATRDEVLLRNGFVTLREGSTIFTQPGATGAPTTTLVAWTSYNVSANGNLGMALTTKVGTTNSAGLYWNTLPVAVKGGTGSGAIPVTGPGIGGPPSAAASFWQVFSVVKMLKDDSGNDLLFLLGKIDNTLITGTREDALARYTVNNVGTVLSTQVLLTKGMILPVLGGSANDMKLEELHSNEHAVGINKHGDYVTELASLSGRISYVMNGDTLLGQQGGPSPLPGHNWSGFPLPKCSINDFRDTVIVGSVADVPGPFLIAKNGQKFVQEGDLLPKFSASPVGKGFASGVVITNSGDIFWEAQSAAGGDDAFMRNDEPIVQQNRTVVGGRLVTFIEIAENSFNVSPNGRFWVGRVDVQGAGSTLVYADFGLVMPIPGCFGNPGKLNLISGKALPGKDLRLAMDNGQDLGVQPVIIFSTAQQNPGSDCGDLTPFGEVIASPSGRIKTILPPAWNGTPSEINVRIPNRLSLVNNVLFAQGFFVGPGPMTPSKFRATNALRIEIGAP